jgi:zinc/manganese transport system substrate-binding protein
MNGLELEGWMTRLVESSGYKGSVLVASRDITPMVVKRGDMRMKDPHAWQDVMKGRSYVVTIELGLIEADPAHADGYRARAAAYDKILSGLNRWVKEQMDQVPKAKRQVITSHDAFGYFGDAYGVKFLAPRGLDTEAEPMAGELGELITQIKTGGIKALFLENMTETKTAEMLAREAGAVIGGTLYVDSLSAADGPAPTYEAMFRHNVPLLRDAMMKNQ